MREPPQGHALAEPLDARTWTRGLACLAATLAIWTLWLVYTRYGVIHGFTPVDIVLLRSGVGGLIFLPYLMWRLADLPPGAWLWGAAFALAQGPLFMLVIALGLRYAPASYGAALAPGVMPLFAALISALAYGQRLRGWRLAGLLSILAGSATLSSYGASFSREFALGSLLFIAAALMAAVYAVALPRSGLSPVLAAAMISVLSMLAFAPIYVLWGGGMLLEASLRDIALQAVLQGVLMAVISLLAYNGAIVLLGTARASTALAITPVATMAAAVPALGEVPHAVEVLGALLVALGIVVANGARAMQRGE
jgi:drug/metabolite transporter (DMT)-like permease